LSLADGQKRFMQAVLELSKAFALCASTDQAKELRDEVGFFQAVRAAFVKATTTNVSTQEDVDTAIQQIISKSGFINRSRRHIRRCRT